MTPSFRLTSNELNNSRTKFNQVCPLNILSNLLLIEFVNDVHSNDQQTN